MSTTTTKTERMTRAIQYLADNPDITRGAYAVTIHDYEDTIRLQGKAGELYAAMDAATDASTAAGLSDDITVAHRHTESGLRFLDTTIPVGGGVVLEFCEVER